jgi:hypothetical protein
MTTQDQRRKMALRIAQTIGRDTQSRVTALQVRVDAFKFNPAQQRDRNGRWTKTGAASKIAELGDKLKGLSPSGKVNSDGVAAHQSHQSAKSLHSGGHHHEAGKKAVSGLAHARAAEKSVKTPPPIMPHGTDEDQLREVNLSEHDSHTIHDALRAGTKIDYGSPKKNQVFNDAVHGITDSLDQKDHRFYPEEYSLITKTLKTYKTKNANSLTKTDMQQIDALIAKLNTAKKQPPGLAN